MIRSIIFELIRRIREDDITAYSAQITYYLLLSIFPFIIFMMSILSKIDFINNYQLNYFEITKIVPNEIYVFIDNIITEVSTGQTDTLLSVSIIITIWSASRGVRAIMKGMNKAYKTKENRSMIKLFIISFLYTIAFAILLTLTIVLLVFGNKISQMLFVYLDLALLYIKLFNTLRYIIPVFFMLFIYLLIYRAAPNIDLSFKQIYIGAVFSTLASFVVSQCFSFYVDNFANYSVIYGSIGSIVILLLWFYLISIIMMLGCELNAAIQSVKERRKRAHH